MRRGRWLAAAGLAVVLYLPAPSWAAPRSCNLITDETGDADDPLSTGNHASPVSNPRLDITGGDLGGSSTSLTAVLRLAAAPGFDPVSPQGETFYVLFTPSLSPRPLFLLAASDDQGSMVYRAGSVDSDASGRQIFTPDRSIPVKGRVAGSTITMTVSTAALRPLAVVKAGSRIDAIHAKTFSGAFVPGVTGVLVAGDQTDPAPRPYLLGSPTCVTPVR